MVFLSTVPLMMMIVRVPQVVVLGVGPGVGGRWPLMGVGRCYSWLGAQWVALLAGWPPSPARALGDADGEGAVGDILCWGRCRCR